MSIHIGPADGFGLWPRFIALLANKIVYKIVYFFLLQNYIPPFDQRTPVSLVHPHRSEYRIPWSVPYSMHAADMINVTAVYTTNISFKGNIK